MVAFTDLGKVQQLYIEAQTLDAAFGNLEAGGEIVNMTISGGRADQGVPPPGVFQPPRMSVSVSTVGILYPPAMVEAIKAALTQRRTAINQELGQLGVSELEAARATQTAQAAAPASARTR